MNTNDIEEKIAWNPVTKYSFLSRTVTPAPNADSFFDFKDAGEVATEIAQGPVAQDSIALTLQGGRFEVGSLSDWIQKAQKLGIEDLIVSYFEANVANAPNLTFPFLGVEL